ncbi:mannose-6-phosphate isomerase, class I [Actinopolymorpha pittospori]
MQLLDNPIRPYAWGSPTAIPRLLGVPPTGEPQAELWMGAHPGSPSLLLGREHSLLDLISADPEGELGPESLQEFGPRLPFLLKLLAAQDPLSLQAHPDPDQAREGFDRENAEGVPLDAPHRNYKDADAKPELICALTPFEALVGFRPPEQTLEAVTGFGVEELEPLLAQLREEPNAQGLRAAFTMLMTAPAERQQAVVDAVLAACEGNDHPDADLARRLGQKYPGDPGVVAALLLNHVQLSPGEALYLPAGNLHAYVQGVGVEILANSDNVLRGGLTAKHIDLPELLRILDFTPRATEVLLADEEGVYDTPAKEFRLSRFEVTGGTEVTIEPDGPQILLCVEGHVAARSELGKVDLTPGRSAWVGATEGQVTLAGEGTVFRAGSGL